MMLGASIRLNRQIRTVLLSVVLGNSEVLAEALNMGSVECLPPLPGILQNYRRKGLMFELE